MRYRNIDNKSVVVTVFSMNAELRIAETRQNCVVYIRDGRAYVRTRAEFLSKFEPVDDSSLTASKV